MAVEELTGSCLCSGVRYRVRGPWLRFVHCHCERCRKATGGSHATNLVAPAGELAWLAGEALVDRYDLPTAASFATATCRRCGSPLPHLTRNGSAWIVPAGSLDAAPALAPQARIFWSSRAPWSCSGDGLPTFDGYPDS